MTTQRKPHPYQSCRDQACELPYCRIWRTAWAEGYQHGLSDGFEAGYDAGYEAGAASAKEK